MTSARRRFVRDVCGLAVAAIAIIAGGIWASSRMDAMLVERVRTGARSEATVLDASLLYIPGGRVVRLQVAYSFRGQRYDAPLMWSYKSDHLRAIQRDDVIDIYIDESAPHLIATEDSGGSDGWVLLLPTWMTGILLAVIVITLGIRVQLYRYGGPIRKVPRDI